jgi:hypothetical protein
MGGLHSIRHLHRTDQMANIEGYQPILEVEIPGTPNIAESGVEQRVDFQREEGKDARITPLEGDGNHRSNVREQLDKDAKLRDLLIDSHHQTNIRIPSVDQGTRSVIDPSTTLLSNHPLIDSFPKEYKEAGALLLEYILKFHEIGTREAANGHFTSVIDPETLVLGEHLPWSDMMGVIRGESAQTRALPWRFHEVRAVLQERYILDSLIDQEDKIISALRSTSDQETQQLEEALKSVKIECLSELLEDWESYFDKHRNSRITEIVNELEDIIGRERALDLLKVPQEAVMHPSKWLCHLLYDLRTGRDPDEIRRHGSYWDTTMHSDDKTYQDIKNNTNERRQDIINDVQRRGLQSTYELVTVTEDSLIRRWYSYNPTDEFDLSHIRYSLVVQQLHNQLRRSGIRPINDGMNPAAIVQNDGEITFNSAQYQLEGVDPFREVIEGEADASDIGRYFEYQTDIDQSYRAWEFGRKKTTKALNFGNTSEMIDWVQTGSQ